MYIYLFECKPHVMKRFQLFLQSKVILMLNEKVKYILKDSQKLSRIILRQICSIDMCGIVWK
jgi:hypothetical protein